MYINKTNYNKDDASLTPLYVCLNQFGRTSTNILDICFLQSTTCTYYMNLFGWTYFECF